MPNESGPASTFISANQQRIIKKDLPRVNELAPQLDRMLAMVVDGALRFTYMEASKHVPEAPDVTEFCLSADKEEYGDERPTIEEGIAQLFLRWGMRLRSGELVNFDENEPRFVENKIALAEEIKKMFVPNMNYHDPISGFDPSPEKKDNDSFGHRIIRYFAEGKCTEPFPEHYNIISVLDERLGIPEKLHGRKASPLLTSDQAAIVEVIGPMREIAFRKTAELFRNLAPPKPTPLAKKESGLAPGGSGSR